MNWLCVSSSAAAAAGHGRVVRASVCTYPVAPVACVVAVCVAVEVVHGARERREQRVGVSGCWRGPGDWVARVAVCAVRAVRAVCAVCAQARAAVAVNWQRV